MSELDESIYKLSTAINVEVDTYDDDDVVRILNGVIEYCQGQIDAMTRQLKRETMKEVE